MLQIGRSRSYEAQIAHTALRALHSQRIQNMGCDCPSNCTFATAPKTCAAIPTRTVPVENGRCAQDTAVTGRHNRRILALQETESDFMLHGFDSLTYLRAQREPCGTPHSSSAALRAGTLNLKCLGVLVVFDSNELAQFSDAVEWQRLREQISRMPLCRNLHHIQPAPVDTAAYSSLSHDESDTAFCLLDQNLKSLPLWTSIPPLTERLSSRFAAQSLSVYVMMWSDRTSPSILRPSDRSPNQKSPRSLEFDHIRIFRV